MPAEINITDTKFFRQLINDIDYTDNPSEFTPNLVGNGFIRIKMTRTINIEWFITATESNPIIVSSSADYLERTNGGWKDGGFSIGDTVDFIASWDSNNEAPLEAQFTIDSFSPDTRRAYITINSGFFSQSEYINAGARGTNNLDTLFYKFGIIENSDVNSFVNTVTDSDQSYYIGGIAGVFTGMVPQGGSREWVTGTIRVKKNSNPSTYVQQFEIEHEFRIPEFATAETLLKLKSNIAPNLYKGTNSPKYIFEVNFQTGLTNPNSKKTAFFFNDLGNVGWNNENFNGLESNYAVDSTVYFETAIPANVVDGFHLGKNTTAFITVSTTRTNPFAIGERVGVIIAYMATSDEYENTPTTFDENFIIDQAYNDIDAAGVSSDFIKDFSIAINGTDIELTIEVDYAVAQLLILDNTKSFVILVDVADPSLSAINSDQVTLLADVAEYVDLPDIPDLFTVNSTLFFDEKSIIGVAGGNTDFEGWNEEGFAVNGEFEVDLNKNAFIESLAFGILAYNSSTGEFFIINEYNVAFTAVIDSNGAQQIAVDTTRGYNLIDGSQFNRVEITTGSFAAGIQKYNYTFGQKIPWQDGIPNPNTDPVFFNDTKPNDNLNLKSSNYSGVLGYDIRFFIRAQMTGTDTIGQSGTADALHISPAITVNDYLENSGTPTYTPVIETFNNDTGFSLGGAIVMDGTDTLLKVTYTPSTPATTVTDITGWNRIEPTDSGFSIDELTNVSTPPLINLLKPIIGEALVKVSLIAGNIVVECLIDGSLIDSNTKYNLSSEIKQIGSLGMLFEDGDQMLFENSIEMLYEQS